MLWHVQERGASSVLVEGASVLALLSCRGTFGDGQRWWWLALFLIVNSEVPG